MRLATWSTIFPYTTLFRSNIRAVAVATNPEQVAKLQDDWDMWDSGVPLEVLISPYRSIVRYGEIDRKSTRLNSSHPSTSYAVFCLKKKNTSGDALARLARR